MRTTITLLLWPSPPRLPRSTRTSRRKSRPPPRPRTRRRSASSRTGSPRPTRNPARPSAMHSCARSHSAPALPGRGDGDPDRHRAPDRPRRGGDHRRLHLVPRVPPSTVQVGATGLDFYTVGSDAFARDGKASVAAFQKGDEALARSPGPRDGPGCGRHVQPARLLRRLCRDQQGLPGATLMTAPLST